MQKIRLVLVLIWIFGVVTALAAEDYPLRVKFSETKPISLSDLFDSYDQFNIVDVRSKFEYDTIHIKKAVHIPVAKIIFRKYLNKIVEGDKNRNVAFYCNGTTCAKSYKAARIAVKEGYTNAYVFDDGIIEWAKVHPDKTVLLGKSPINLDHLISNEKFLEKCISKDKFEALAKEENAVIIDIRDPIQRKQTPNFAKNVDQYNMDVIVERLKKKGFRKRMQSKKLLIFDAVGKQVRWFQYYLKDSGIKNYYFLKKGAWSYFGSKGAVN